MNLKLNLSAIMVLLSSIILAQTGSIKIDVMEVENTKGVVQIGLYNQEEDFPDFEKNFQGSSIKATNGEIKYTFTNVPVGKYAVAVWHDENENKKIDKNMFGVPKEKYGFSNNEFKTFGPPDFEDASFEVLDNDTVSLTINLK